MFVTKASEPSPAICGIFAPPVVRINPLKWADIIKSYAEYGMVKVGAIEFGRSTKSFVFGYLV
jgi:hypothetical protein